MFSMDSFLPILTESIDLADTKVLIDLMEPITWLALLIDMDNEFKLLNLLRGIVFFLSGD